MPERSVFISHYTRERKFADAINEFLSAEFRGLEVFQSTDEGESLPAGTSQFQRICGALSSASIVVGLISNRSVQRPWLAFECGFAQSSEIEIRTLR